MTTKQLHKKSRSATKKSQHEISHDSKVIARLQESEQLFRTLIEQSLAGTYVVQDGKFRMLNPIAASYAGYTPEKLIGRKSDCLVHPEDRKEARDNVCAMLSKGCPALHEFRIVTKQGDIRWIMETVTSILFEGKPALQGNSMDITKRKRTEEALQESERLLADIIDFLPEATFAIDLDGKVIIWNRAIEEMTGVPAEDMLGKGNCEYALPFYAKRRPIMADLVLKPDKKLEKRYNLILERQKDLLIVESWVPCLRGKRAYLWTKASALYNSKGEIVGAIESLRDITERKQAEEALQESERRLADIIDFLPDATVAIDLNGKVIAWNRAIEEMTGVSAEDMLGKGNYEYALPFYGEHRPIMIDLVLNPDKKIEKRYSYILKRQKDLLIVETWVPCLKGEAAFLWGKATPLYNSKGAIIGAIESIRDITEHKQAEEALQESERRLADIIDFLPDATVAIDLNGKVIAWNRAIEEMTGVSAEDMLGKGNYEYALPFYGEHRPIMIDLVLNPDKKIEKRYSYILKRQKDLLIVETWVPSLKGERAFLWGKATPLYNSKGEIVVAIQSIRDITERKHAEEALKKREEDLEIKTHELEDLNAALRVLLRQRDEDRNDLEEKILSNIKTLILPYIERMKNHTDSKGISYVNVIESNLKEIISPFAKKLFNKYLDFTNREVQIADLIREGKTTKEISELLNVSDSAVNVYRYHIRKKLNLSKKHNLRSYLSSLG